MTTIDQHNESWAVVRSTAPAVHRWLASLPQAHVRFAHAGEVYIHRARVTEARRYLRWSDAINVPEEWTNGPLAEPYSTLHLLPTAPSELVKNAYKTLAKLHHPDRGGDENAFKTISAAYKILTSNRQVEIL